MQLVIPYDYVLPSTCTRYASTQSWCCFWVIAAVTEAPLARPEALPEGLDQRLQLGPGQAADGAMELLNRFWR